MFKKQALSIFIFISLFCLNVAAQGKKEFSSDPKVFGEDIAAFFNDSRDPDAKKIMDKFSQYWLSSAFTDQEKSATIETSNAMLKQKLRLKPDFMSYYDMLNVYKDKKIT